MKIFFIYLFIAMPLTVFTAQPLFRLKMAIKESDVKQVRSLCGRLTVSREELSLLESYAESLFKLRNNNVQSLTRSNFLEYVKRIFPGVVAAPAAACGAAIAVILPAHSVQSAFNGYLGEAMTEIIFTPIPIAFAIGSSLLCEYSRELVIEYNKNLQELCENAVEIVEIMQDLKVR